MRYVSEMYIKEVEGTEAGLSDKEFANINDKENQGDRKNFTDETGQQAGLDNKKLEDIMTDIEKNDGKKFTDEDGDVAGETDHPDDMLTDEGDNDVADDVEDMLH